MRVSKLEHFTNIFLYWFNILENGLSKKKGGGGYFLNLAPQD